MIVENGHKKAYLKKLVKDDNAKKNKANHNYTNSNKIPWVPNSGSKVMKELKKINKYITFTFSKNLQSILRQNKPKLLTSSHPEVHLLDCLCNGRYIEKSKKKVLALCIEQQQDSIKGGSHPAPYTPKSIMDNSTGFTQE